MSAPAMRGDFHLHSHYSDGRLPPATVIDRAAAAGLGVVALTDHDNTLGIAEAIEAGERAGVRVIPGVEISAISRGVDVHLLGLGVDPGNAALSAMFDRLLASRRTRGDDIVAALVERHVPISIDRVREIAGEGAIGRPHVAHALIEAGFATDVDDAFSRWLSPGRPGYVSIRHVDAPLAIQAVHDAGGIVSLAHPTLYHHYDGVIRLLAPAGLDAVEAIHPDVNPDQRRKLERLAADLGLGITGGSDDHGFEGKLRLGEVYLSGGLLDRLLQLIAS